MAGHLDADIHNPTAPHIKKSSGLTPRERESWSTTLAEAGVGGAGLVGRCRLTL